MTAFPKPSMIAYKRGKIFGIILSKQRFHLRENPLDFTMVTGLVSKDASFAGTVIKHHHIAAPAQEKNGKSMHQ